jgi:hypothetical protein
VERITAKRSARRQRCLWRVRLPCVSVVPTTATSLSVLDATSFDIARTSLAWWWEEDPPSHFLGCEHVSGTLELLPAPFGPSEEAALLPSRCRFVPMVNDSTLPTVAAFPRYLRCQDESAFRPH